MADRAAEGVDRLLATVSAWARLEPNVRGVALVGSHARGRARPGSDVDLVILTQKPEGLAREPSWLHAFGQATSVSQEDWGRVTSLRARYRGGLEVEFGLTDPSWAAVPVDEGTRRVVGDGIRVVYDPDGAFARLLAALAS